METRKILEEMELERKLLQNRIEEFCVKYIDISEIKINLSYYEGPFTDDYGRYKKWVKLIFQYKNLDIEKILEK